MLVTKQPVLRRFWYPVLPESELGEAPVPFTLLGEDIVLWRTADGSVGCVQDRCCHRTAKLSVGFVKDGNIACGYHGWEYDAAGDCVCIPQQADPHKISSGVQVPAYRAELKYGHVWVALDEPLTGIPHFPEDEEGLRRIDQFYEEWKIGGLRLMENSFDAAHIAFVHKDTFGDISRPTTNRHNIEEFDYGFNYSSHSEVKNRDGVSNRYLGGETSEDTVRQNRSTWHMPLVRRLGITYPTGLRHTIITAATPMTDNRTMLVQWCYRSDTEEEAKAEDIIAFDRAVTLEDKEVLEATEFDVPLDNRDTSEFHMYSDTPGLRMRRMLSDLLEKHGETDMRLAS